MDHHDRAADLFISFVIYLLLLSQAGPAISLLTAALAAAGYRQADLTIGIVRANVLAVVLCLPIVAVLLMAFFALHPEGGGGGLTLGGILGFLP